jgi:hypothetical protein
MFSILSVALTVACCDEEKEEETTAASSSLVVLQKGGLYVGSDGEDRRP